MNEDIIIKLLRSENQGDILLGYEYLTAEYGSNSYKMNKMLYETNIRINHYQGKAYLTLYSIKGGRHTKPIRKI